MSTESKELSYEDAGFATKAIHAGQSPVPVTGAVVTPISLATTFVQTSPGDHTGFEYGRTGNPTRLAWEKCVASLEDAKYGLAFSSGSACTATITNLLQAGDHVICCDVVYMGVHGYFKQVATASQGVEVSMVDLNEPGELEKAIRPNTRMLWLESPTNPTLKICDIEKLSAIAHKHNILVVVDNTFMSPYFQSPLSLGADLVIHSVTKYLNGHSDVVMGAVITNDEELYSRLKFLQNSIGAVPSPFDCYLALRGVKTLAVRMELHAANAMAVAQFLESHDMVEKVVYPGLASHPQHGLAKKQMRGFGGMVIVYVKGGQKEAQTFLDSLRLFSVAASLGAVESLAEHPPTTTHTDLTPAQRASIGVNDNMCRLSIGIEDAKDLISDLANALDAVKAMGSSKA